MRIRSARHYGFMERGSDRRQSNGSLHYPERRTGFDRRRPPPGSWQARYRNLLEEYRGNPDTIAAALFVFVVLNIADLLLTVRAISLGAVEINPVMNWLFSVDPEMAAVFKLVVGGLIAVAVWTARKYRRMLETSLALVAVMTIVLLYHGYSALF